MEEIVNDLKTALEVVFGKVAGNQNEAIQWIQNFQNRDDSIMIALYLLHSSQNNGTIVFGILKLLVQRIFLGWYTILPANASEAFNSVLTFIINNPSLPQYANDAVIDILASLYIITAETEHSPINNLLEAFTKGHLNNCFIIRFFAAVPSMLSRLSDYLYRNTQDGFDKKWSIIKNVCFQTGEEIINSTPQDVIFSSPELFQSICQFLTNWFTLSSDDALSSFSVESRYNNAAYGKSIVSTQKIRIAFQDLDKITAFKVLMNCFEALCKPINKSELTDDRTELYCTLLSICYSTCYDLLFFSSPSYNQLASKQLAEAYQHILYGLTSVIIQSKTTTFQFLSESETEKVQFDPIPRLIDSISRLVTEHINIIVLNTTLLAELHHSCIDILNLCSNLNYCNLIADTLNEFYSNLTEIPAIISDQLPELLSILIQRAALPYSYYESNQIQLEYNDEKLRRFRQSCQDIVLAISSTSIGVEMTATILLNGPLESSQSIALQESMIYLFCGVVDAIEEEMLSLFHYDDEDMVNYSIHSLKRNDISTTPLITKYDSILNYFFINLNHFTTHPLLLLSALQVMFSFDNWTFSRQDYCYQLYDYLIYNCTIMPEPILPRLLQYICRLHESPCFLFTPQLFQKLLDLSQHITSFHNITLLAEWNQVISTSICHLPESVILSTYHDTLSLYMQTLASSSSSLQDLQACYKCIESIICGCLVDEIANTIASGVLPIIQEQFNTLMKWQKSGQKVELSLIELICQICIAIVKTADLRLDNVNASCILALCNELMQNSLLVHNALEIIDIMLNNSFTILTDAQQYNLLCSVTSYLNWLFDNHLIKQNIDDIKLIIRIQYLFLKENKIQNEFIYDMIQLLLRIVHEMINEEELIRLLLRSISFITQKYSPSLQSILVDILVACFSLAMMSVQPRLQIQIHNQIVQLLINDKQDKQQEEIAMKSVMQLFADNRLPILTQFSTEFKQKCVLLLTTCKKNTILRNVISDIVNVLTGTVGEDSFMKKYC